MNLVNVVKAFLPHIDKTKVIEDLRITTAEVENFALPSYLHATDYFKVSKMKALANKDLESVFYRNFDQQGGVKQPNFVAEIYKRLPYIKENTDYVLSLAEELYERDIINEGLTAKKAVLLRAASSLSFVSRFSVDLLNLLYVNEAIQANAAVEDSMQLSPAVIKHVNENIGNFARLLSDYGIPNKKFSNIVLEIPEVIISSKTADAVKGLYKEQDIDPFTNVFKSGFTGSPIYHVRMVVAEWQSNRYKANKDKKKMLELRLLHLKMLNDNKNDPKLEQEINYIQGRVDRINRYLSEVEDSLA